MKETLLALLVGLAPVGSAHAQNYSGATADAKARPESGEALLKRSGCGKCHALQTNLAAPALKSISAKYRGRPDAAAMIVATVKNGRHGREVLTMPAHSSVSDADARTIADYILSLGKR